MNYLDCKKLEKEIVKKCNGNILAFTLYQQTIGGSNGYVAKRINSYKYNFSDLDKDEIKLLLSLNNLLEDDILIGGEVHRCVYDINTKSKRLKKVHEIDLFKILDQINWIKTK